MPAVENDKLEKVERSLREIDERFQLFVESAKDYAMFILDPHGVITTWNEGAKNIKGYEADEIIGKHFSLFYLPQEVAAGKCDYELEVAAKEGRFEDEGIRVRKDGTTFWANVIITALRDASGELIGFAKITRDLTERRRAEQERVRLAQEQAARAEAERALKTLLQLQELGIVLAGVQAPRSTMETIVERASAALAAEASSLLRLRDGVVELAATKGSPLNEQQQFHHYPVATRVIGCDTLRTGEPEWVETREAFAATYTDSPARGVAGAACALPLAGTEGVFGAIVFRFREPRAFAPTERAFLLTLAGQASQALERAEIRTRVTEARQRLEALSELAQALSTAHSLAEVAKVIVERGRTAAGADTCSLHRLDPSIPALMLLDERGCHPEVVQRVQVIPRDLENPSWHAIETGTSVWGEDEHDYARRYPLLSRARTSDTSARRVQAFWAVPLVTEDITLGLLGMGFYEPRKFSADERAFVATFARHCSDAMLRARRLEDEQRARTAAETARASLATTLRSIGDAVIATDEKGCITMMNPVAETLTGWREDEARGRPLADVFVIVSEHTRATVPSPVDRVLETGTVVGVANHTVLLAKDGREVPIDDSAAPIRGAAGQIEGVVLVFRDVAEKKKDDARRALLEQSAAALAESLDYEVTLAKVARLAVPSFADWCGVDLAEGGVRTKQVAVAHVDPAKVEFAREFGHKFPPDPNSPHGVPAVLRSGKSEIYPVVTDEMIRASARGDEYLRMSLELHVRSVIIVPLLAHGRTIGAMTFIWAESENHYSESDLAFAEELARRCANAIDNARLYDAEQQARNAADAANRAKDEFLATVSHELRTPLNAIMGWAKMLSTNALDPTKRERAIATIDRNAVAMAQLIEDLLDISRIISGKMRLEVQSVNLERVLEAAIDSVRPAADAKEIVIRERVDDDAQTTTGDPGRLQQVIWNLLSNAVKFTPRKGHIDVELTRDDAGIDILVRDDGRGIDPRFLPHVFEAFRQEDASHTRTRGGLGLGLAITKQLVELHGGHVSATSEGEGKGATFRVQLPAAPLTRGSQRSGRVPKLHLDTIFRALPRLDGVDVLVVDDEEDARLLLKTVLEEVGARVTTAGGVDDALRAIAAAVPNVLVSDIGMPVRDGYELIRAVRADHPDLAAAALTAYARTEDRRRTLDAGFTVHISKPVDPVELVTVVASLVKSS